MKIAIANDHGGLAVKMRVVAAINAAGHEVLDFGVNDACAVDYPDYAAAGAEAVRSGKADRGILICGSGVGICVAANKFPGIRAAVCHDPYSARQGVEHDDMNVLCLGARVIGDELAATIVSAFLGAHFSAEERHLRRLNKVLDIEKRFAPRRETPL